MAVVGLTACASLQPSPSSLPVKTVGAESGKVFSTRAFESQERLYVAGQAKPHRFRTATHIDVQLIAADGRIVVETMDEIEPVNPRTRHARGGKVAYVVSFPIHEARQAKWIRVIFHDERHS